MRQRECLCSSSLRCTTLAARLTSPWAWRRKRPAAWAKPWRTCQRTRSWGEWHPARMHCPACVIGCIRGQREGGGALLPSHSCNGNPFLSHTPPLHMHSPCVFLRPGRYMAAHAAGSACVEDALGRMGRWHASVLSLLHHHSTVEDDVLARVAAEFERLEKVMGGACGVQRHTDAAPLSFLHTVILSPVPRCAQNAVGCARRGGRVTSCGRYRLWPGVQGPCTRPMDAHTSLLPLLMDCWLYTLPVSTLHDVLVQTWW